MCRFAVKSFDVRVADRRWRLYGPADPDEMLDEPDLEQAYQTDGYLPYWADLWPASRLLAGFVLRLPPAEASETAVELGCGLGLAGLAAAAVGRRVHFTDYEPLALAFAAANARRNDVSAFDAFLLDFRNPPPRQYPLVLAADILYEGRLREVVPELLRRILPVGGRALIADPDRAAVKAMMEKSPPAGFSVAAHADAATMPDGKTIEGTIWELVRR